MLELIKSYGLELLFLMLLFFVTITLLRTLALLKRIDKKIATHNSYQGNFYAEEDYREPYADDFEEEEEGDDFYIVEIDGVPVRKSLKETKVEKLIKEYSEITK